MKIYKLTYFDTSNFTSELQNYIMYFYNIFKIIIHSLKSPKLKQIRIQ